MRSFAEIHAIAAGRKGGAEALEALVEKPSPPDEVAASPDDRWLSSMARSLFEAGFNRKVIAAKWPGFEAAFEGFDVDRIAFYADAEMDRLLADRRVVRNGAKLAAVIDNALFLRDIRAGHGSPGRFFATWPDSDYVGLLDLLATRGSRLGGVTGQRMLRRMGRSSLILSTDVVARLVAEGIVTKTPSSRRDMRAVQTALNAWMAESGRSLTEISRVLAMSV